ncbi:hypothetical protein Lal_00040252 [Lupinus albus]|uniref:Putative TIR domain-containing protein n=1 Tax=Lupinus albus TaxID=3870 RepID=A0A6A5MSD4_LUPAL|nr:putative TIR domain-containing protein [Lupinus albus]KAF1877536.1 hypothetical protein Lal_00040252 [Lupinus albus]
MALPNHEMFISFRGEDTRKTFTSHLNSAMERLDIRTYIDNNLERGDTISMTLLKAIENAKLSLIIFSKNYANSKWCLDELVKIVECAKTKGQIIMPVFYDVSPSDVRHQTGTYEEAFSKHEENVEEEKKIKKWRKCLVVAANCAGWDCYVDNRTESEIVEGIARKVLEKLDKVYVGDIDQEIKKNEQLLEAQQQYFDIAICYDKQIRDDLQATKLRVAKLKYDRCARLLRFDFDLNGSKV